MDSLICNQPICKSKQVRYVLTYDRQEIAWVQFSTIINANSYFAKYYFSLKRLDVSHLSKTVFSIKFESLHLTPHNIDSKLPTLITFS